MKTTGKNYNQTINNSKVNDIWNKFEYGRDLDKLRPGVEVKNQDFNIGNFTITGTGNKSIIGVGFKPRLIEFFIADNSGSTGRTGVGVAKKIGTTTTQYCLNQTNSVISTTECIYYGNPIIARATLVSTDKDGFTINCSYFTVNTYVFFKCYK